MSSGIQNVDGERMSVSPTHGKNRIYFGDIKKIWHLSCDKCHKNAIKKAVRGGFEPPDYLYT
jgi:hypothetical protein